MNRVSISLVALTFATISFAETQIDRGGIQAIAYNDGVLFESSDNSTNYQLNVAGAGDSGYQRSYETSGYLFLDTSAGEDGQLADGLYKYEARPIPAVTISREDSSAMSDRNSLVGKTTAKVSPVSGTFRILNGKVVDSMIEEDYASASEGAVE